MTESKIEKAATISVSFPFISLHTAAATAAKSLQSCLTPQGSPVPGILQARTLEWVAISFSNAWKWKGKVKSLSCVRPSVTPWTAAHQAPPSMGFSRQEHWSGVPLPSPSLHTSTSQIWEEYISPRSSLPVQWLGLPTFTAEGPGLSPGQGARISQAEQLCPLRPTGNLYIYI